VDHQVHRLAQPLSRDPALQDAAIDVDPELRDLGRLNAPAPRMVQLQASVVDAVEVPIQTPDLLLGVGSERLRNGQVSRVDDDVQGDSESSSIWGATHNGPRSPRS